MVKLYIIRQQTRKVKICPTGLQQIDQDLRTHHETKTRLLEEIFTSSKSGTQSRDSIPGSRHWRYSIPKSRDWKRSLGLQSLDLTINRSPRTHSAPVYQISAKSADSIIDDSTDFSGPFSRVRIVLLLSQRSVDRTTSNLERTWASRRSHVFVLYFYMRATRMWLGSKIEVKFRNSPCKNYIGMGEVLDSLFQIQSTTSIWYIFDVGGGHSAVW